jgi:hypothetical protein
MKSNFAEQNLKIARLILKDPGKFDGLAVEWARLVVRNAAAEPSAEVADLQYFTKDEIREGKTTSCSNPNASIY